MSRLSIVSLATNVVHWGGFGNGSFSLGSDGPQGGTLLRLPGLGVEIEKGCSLWWW